jgi:hypothetical protein
MQKTFVAFSRKTLAACLLSCTIAAAPAFADTTSSGGIKVFPPDNCTVQGQTYLLSWDGKNNTQCLLLPTCGNMQALEYDGSNLNCVDPNATNTNTNTNTNNTNNCGQNWSQTNWGSCPDGEQGVTYDWLVTDTCTGNSWIDSHVDSCAVYIPAVSSIACTPGDILYGQFDGQVFNQNNCANGGCSNYLCTTSGLVQQ